MKGMSRSILAIGLTTLMLVAAACGDDDDSSSGGSAGGGTTTEAAKPKIKVGLVTDIGGLNDRGFNQLANQGLQRAKKELGIDVRVITSDQNSDYVPNLSTLAQQKFDLIIANGFLMGEATATVAKRFPDAKFAIIDFPQAAMKGKPANVQGLLFRENEAGYIVGYLAGLYGKDNDVNTVSSVGGQKVPAVDNFIAGYDAGAKAANPDVKTLSGYSQDFVDQAKCKEMALDQIQRGSGVVFAVAGQCGLGAIDAAKERDVKAIGVDADQSYLGPQVITSAVKRVELAVFETAKAAQAGTFEAGTDRVFDVKSDGVGYGKLSADATKYEPDLKAVQEKIASGELEVPSAG
jgi:basic membrane protein A